MRADFVSMKNRLLYLLVFVAPIALGQSMPRFGVDSVNHTFFDCWYGQGDLVHYLDNLNDYTVYEGETTGEWAQSNQLIFSVSGNSYRQNRYYIDGYRVDSRFHAGSTQYRPNMLYHDLLLDNYQSKLQFLTDTARINFVSVKYNIGGLGGVSPGTKQLINLFHSSAIERELYPHTGLDPEKNRPHLLGAGQVEAQYFIPTSADTARFYRQHLYADFGCKDLVMLNQTGIYGMQKAWYYKVQGDGEIPLQHNPEDATMHYRFNIQNTEARGEEFYFNPDEWYKNLTYGAMLYFKSSPLKGKTRWTSGMTWETNETKHANQNFSRNLIDQDGEAFEPFVPDGQTHELSLAATVEHFFFPWLRLHYDGYNSAIFFQPNQKEIQNNIYWESMYGNEKEDLYTIFWQSNPFTSGILENTLGIEYKKALTRWFTLQANLDFTLDGILLAGKSIVRPNGQAQVALDFHPCRWFTGALNVGLYRMQFNIEDIHYLSSDYLSGEYRFSDGTLYRTTGGKYHKITSKAWQPNYFVVDIPLQFTFGRHEITVLSQYRKYFNLWTTRLQSDDNYLITPETYKMGDNWFVNTPYYASNLIKYTYNGKKWYVSLSWQSYQMTALATFGNGPLHNNIGVLSESTSDELSYVVYNNPDSRYAAVGRANQDKAYICRFMVAYNICRSWHIGMSFKFKDGQPFSNYYYELTQDEAGHTLVDLRNRRTKGINPADGNFGSRKDAFFNLDVNIRYRAFFKNNSMLEVQLYGYNLYDFATELTEFSIEENNESNRSSMSLIIPRGLWLSLKYQF